MANTYKLITSTTLTGTQASVTISSIPATYTDLLVKTSIRYNGSSGQSVFVRFNSATTNYSMVYIEGSGSSVGANAWNTTGIWVDTTYSTDSSIFTNAEFYIPNYTGSNYKSVSSDITSENNASATDLSLIAGLWSDASAINSLYFYPNSGSFVSGSTFYVYGISKS